MKISVKKLVVCGILSAFALISFMLENLLPPLCVVGGRIGISNLFILLAGLLAGFWYGCAALVIKTVFGSIFGGNISAVLYSLPAGAIAYFSEMLLLLYAKRVSIIAASAFGGALNACLQNAAFCIITATPEYLIYMPYLALIGTAGGLIVGAVVFFTIKYLPDTFSDFATKDNTQKE